MEKLVVACLYMVAIIAIGMAVGRKVKDAKSFATGNGEIPFWTNVYSMSSAWIGAGATLGCASMGYAYGLSGFYLAISVGIGSILSSLFFAKKIREEQVTTIPELIRKTLGTKVANLISILIIFQVFSIVASQMRALGTILGMLIPSISLFTAMVIMGIVMLGYTLLGGMVSATRTDKLNISLMLLAVLVILPIVCLSHVGGISNFLAHTDSKLLNPVSLGTGAMLSSGLYFCTSSLLNSENFLRICGAKSASEARNASLLATLMVYIPYLIFATLAGFLGTAIISQLGTSDSILSAIINQKTNAIVGAVLLSALLAAVMGTAASVTMLTSVTISRDIVARIVSVNDQQLLTLQRVIMIFVAVLGLVVGYYGDSIVSIMENVGAPCGAAVVPIFFGIFYMKDRMTPSIGLVTIVVAVACTLGYWGLGSPLGISHFLFGIICSTITLIVSTSMKLGHNAIAVNE